MANNKRFDGPQPLEGGGFVTVPTIHSNGSDGNRLFAEIRNVIGDVRAARYALQGIAPHGRDYYPQDPGPGLGGASFMAAVGQHKSRVKRLEDIEKELQAVCEGIEEQLDAKKARK